MDRFERVLNEVLKGWHVGDTTPPATASFRGFAKGNYGRGKINTSDAYHSVKYARIVSDRLSQLTKHDIIILVGNGLQKYVGGPSGKLLKRMDRDHERELSRITGIPVEDFEKSFTIMIIGNQGQPRLSPWLILHQVGECIVQNISDFWNETIAPKYERYLKRVPKELDIPQDVLRRSYGDDDPPDYEALGVEPPEEEDEISHPYEQGARWEDLAFHRLFKMKSAREFIHGGFDNIDPSQEIIVDYLWHGGNIRMNKPDWIPPQVVDAIHRDITTWIDRVLTRLAGYRLLNTPDQESTGGDFNAHVADMES